MRYTYALLAFALAVLLLPGILLGQSNGDYRSLPSGASPHLWGTASNWQIYNDTTLTWGTATSAPSSGNNVTIRTGDTISVGQLAQCNNLTVEAGAYLQTDNRPVTSPVGVRVFGTTITDNGTIGKTGGDGLVINPAGVSGNTLTLSGAGSCNVARVEMYRGNNTFVFNMNVGLYYAGADGRGGSGLQANTDSTTYTINAGKTVTFAQNSGISLGSSADTNSVAISATLNVSGTLDLSQSGSNVILKSSAGDSTVVHILTGGSMTVAGSFWVTTLHDGGKPSIITVDGTGTLTCRGNTDFSFPNMKVTGTGTFTLGTGGTLIIGHPQGITTSGATGAIQTSTRTFSGSAYYTYADTAAQVTGNALPSEIRGLGINNAGGLTLGGSLLLDSTLTLTSGKITLGTNNLTLAAPVIVTGGSDASYIVTDNTGTVTRNSVGAVYTLFPVGIASTYNPVGINNAGTSDNYSVRVKNSFDNPPADPTKVVNRQWTVSEAVAGGSNATVYLQWKSADQAASFDPNGSVAISRYAAGWQDVGAEVTGSSPYVAKANGITTFSNFIVDNAALPSFHVAPAAVAYGGVAVSTPKQDSVQVKNAGSVALNISSAVSDNALYTVSPSSKIIAGGDSARFVITFTPTAGGPSSAHIIFAHNAAGSPDTVSVSGIGLVAGPALYVVPGSLNYVNTLVGRTRRDSITVMNDGSATLTIDSAGIRSSADYSVTPSGPLTITPTSTQKFYVTFAPTAGGSRPGYLVLYSNGTPSKDTIALSGTGVAPIVSTGTHPAGASWNSTSTWAGGVIPVSSDSVIIASPDSVYVTTVDSCYGLFIQSGAKLGMHAKIALRDITVNGLIKVAADTLSPTDTMTIGGTYQHGRDGGQMPRHTRWLDGSTFLVTGATSTTTVGETPGQSYYNITWNCPSQTANMNLGMDPNVAAGSYDTTTTIRGDVNVISTGLARLYFCGPAVGTSSQHTISRVIVNGSINVANRSILSSNGTSNGYTDIFITVNGNIHVRDSASQLSISRGSQGTGLGTVTWYIKSDSVIYGRRTSNQNSTDPNTAATTRGKFIFCKPGLQIIQLDSLISWSGECNMQFGDSTTVTTIDAGNSPFGGSAVSQRIKRNATVILGQYGSIGGGTNSQSVQSNFAIDAGATLITGSSNGLRATGHGNSGAVQVSGNRNYGVGASYGYNGTMNQGLGSGFPAVVENLTISSGRTVTADSVARFTVDGTLAVQAGHLDLNGDTVTLGPVATLSEASGATVKGASGVLTTTRTLNAPSASVNIAGLGVNIGSASDLGTTVITRGHAPQTGATGTGISRYFDITPTNDAGLNATLVVAYDTSELNGQNASTLLLWKTTNNGVSWTPQAVSGNLAQHTLTATGVNSLSRWSISDAGNPIGGIIHVQSLASGWNMVSLPLIPDNDSVSANYSTAISRAFAYQGTYKSVLTMSRGTGYWIKYGAATQLPFFGVPFSTDTINVTTGWNMIGGVSQPFPVTSIISNPGGITTGYFFGYSTRYVKADTLVPGMGYWIKVSQPGQFYLTSGPSDVMKRIRIMGNGEQPPAPPAGDLTSGGQLLPTEFSLGNNYPNPFNPATRFVVAVPADAPVEVSVYDLLGQKVRTLMAGPQAAGYHTVEWNGLSDRQLQAPSGVYFLRMSSGSFSAVRKIMMMK